MLQKKQTNDGIDVENDPIRHTTLHIHMWNLVEYGHQISYSKFKF